MRGRRMVLFKSTAPSATWLTHVGTILFYIAKSGTFDENNSMLKLGRVRLAMDPSPFASNATFEQRLILNDGYVTFKIGNGTVVSLWVDVFNPVIHVNVKSATSVGLTLSYENWRYKDRIMVPGEQAQSSWGVGTSAPVFPIAPLTTYADNISFSGDDVLAYHRNSQLPLWDFQTEQQNLTEYKDTLYNPMRDNTFGILISSPQLRRGDVTDGHYINTDFKAWSLVSPSPVTEYDISLTIAQNQTSTLEDWMALLKDTVNTAARNTQEASISWWNDYWKRSYIIVNEDAGATDGGFQVGKNYQLFRYMMGCNAFGQWPTKFNGGLFTFDPVFVASAKAWTPDYRRWGGGTFTAQNQRLLYWPLLKSGDFDVMRAQFDFYKRIEPAVLLRGQLGFNVNASFHVEQIDNTGLSNLYEFNGNYYRNVSGSRERPEGFPAAMDFGSYQTWVQDTANEFIDMILQANIYSGFDVTPYMPFIENQLRWFDLFYQKLHTTYEVFPLTGNSGKGKLVIFPGSAAETYKGAYNPSSTTSGLKKCLTDLLAVAPAYTVGSKEYYTGFLARVPDTPLRVQQGQICIAPALAYDRIQNSEIPQLYPVFPWGEFGLGLPNLTYAQNTYALDTETQGAHADYGWKQDGIWLARMGLTDGAARDALSRFADSTTFRFSAFKGPNFDWAPDMNHYGAAAIGLQEQLLQTFAGRSIRIVPAWPKTWSGRFKLHAPYNTTVQGTVKDGEVLDLVVEPAERMADVVFGTA
ncbi:uncharacterized protein M421DRAFT_183247 [Didymella exigua CBS 183.55]|uniref:DUF5703 domain-containing protein n=1 Tax=Didymella exigua CBS 183.55 TaxID=1150837 RepID=A0A6A5RJ75_9PLEO|nr:uncharacterized protein M421DRAFT_183247 [Didymella exigua CBS 183.55]KAF1927158.1 hypothetical protein M421DRAFT_183247 [Didymella exigua CBS 183.55]